MLNVKFVEEVMRRIPAECFAIQTNGTLVEKLDPKYWRLFDAVLLSIDGRREITNHYRGKGIYEMVIKSALRLRRLGFRGDLIARMTVSERSDIYLEVTHLASLGLFDHIHWQLDVIWSDRWSNFDLWASGSYKPGISKLIDFWMDRMERGRLIGIAPFLSITSSIIFRKSVPSPSCEAGRRSFAISTDGRIYACPIAVSESWSLMGDIWTKEPEEIRDSMSIGDPCLNCEDFEQCGGRCLYAYKERYWGEEGFRKVCSLTRHLIGELRRRSPRVESLIKDGKIRKEGP